MNPFVTHDSAVRSLNRARIAALPSSVAADDMLGKTGYELLSAVALQELIQSFAAAPTDLPAAFANPATRPAAQQAAIRYGQRLGCLLLMLKVGDPANRAARPTWSDAHWAFWRDIEHVRVGGGLVAGEFGSCAVDAARQLLHDNRCRDLDLQRSPFAAHIVLAGLARFKPPSSTSVLAFDFGQTAVKWTLVATGGDGLVDFNDVQVEPTVCAALYLPTETLTSVRQRWERMLNIIEHGWQAVPSVQRTTTAIAVALACYLNDGHPSPHDQGCYGRLQWLGPNLRMLLRQALKQRLDGLRSVTLAHDGAAAAAAHAGLEHAVVLTLGTAIGNGFPPLLLEDGLSDA